MSNQQQSNQGWIERQEAGPVPPSSSERSSWRPAWVTYLLGILGVLYLINPTAGLFELIPDNLPFVGNLDDGVAAVLIWTGMQEYLRNRRAKRENL